MSIVNEAIIKAYESEGFTYITPELAKEWLSNNPRNRNLLVRVVKRLAKDIENGNWQMYNPDHIGFYEGGDLANGQHRLNAIVMANKPVFAKVDYDIPKTSATYIDTGRARSAADNAKIATGKDFYTNSITHMIAVASKDGRKYSYTEHIFVAENYEEEIVFINEVFAGKQKFMNRVAIKAAVFTAYMDGVRKDQLVDWLQILSTGRATDDASESVVKFRDKLMAESLDKKRSVCFYQAEMKRAQNCIYNYLKGKSVSVIRFPENYRYPLVDFLGKMSK